MMFGTALTSLPWSFVLMDNKSISCEAWSKKGLELKSLKKKFVNLISYWALLYNESNIFSVFYTEEMSDLIYFPGHHGLVV